MNAEMNEEKTGGVDSAAARFEAGINCSQAVFSVFAAKYGLDPELALKIAAPFGGGMGRLGEVCGAVSGALMALGLAEGGANEVGKEQAYYLTQEFAERFQERHGALTCRELIGYRLIIPEERKAAREQDVFHTRCPHFVASAEAIARELLAEAGR